MGTVDGLRAVTVLSARMTEAGLVRTSGMNGAEITGWTRDFGSTGFSVRHDRATGLLGWNVVLSGRPHLSYRSWTESNGDDDTIRLHEPRNPDALLGRVESVLRGMGLEVKTVSCNGYQTHWDDDVNYLGVTEFPAWLLAENLPRQLAVGGLPALVSYSPGRRFSQDLLVEQVRGLVGYDDGGGPLLTRESMELLAASPPLARDASWRPIAPERRAAISFDGDRLSVRRGGDEILGIVASEVVNHWGDRLAAWRLPRDVLERQLAFAPGVPFVCGGETLEALDPIFRDAQFGGDAPWLADAAPPSPRR